MADVHPLASGSTTTEPRAFRESPIGPGSLTWRVFGQRAVWLLAPYTGTLQNMHPAVGQSLQQVSNFLDDPMDRFLRSIPPIMGVVYDDEDAQTGRLVRDFHRDVKGELLDGSRYHALDPDTFWWTHATFIDVVISLEEFFGTPLTEAQKDQVIREGVTWWQRYGLSMRPVIDNYADFRAYWEHMHDNVLESNKTTEFAVGRLGKIAVPRTFPMPIPVTLWSLLLEPIARRLSPWLMSAMMTPRGREILGLTWSQRDQQLFSLLQPIVRATWRIVPRRIKYFPRAYASIAKRGL
ncbi:oxygenase MpaB family protein [Mycobacteroides franklinii]|uniref:oxygenase MpaB family protein n=1 Tax=Mycobacteroides franklinii TaxID=948102 RepID=UPI0018E2E356|nr:oxygenase MpaB family protein [Mycobacteroides franklinii]